LPSCLEDLFKNVIELNESRAIDAAKHCLESGEDPLKVLDQMLKALRVAGEKYEKGEFFIPELIAIHEIFKKVSELVRARIREVRRGQERIGKLVIGVVQGDMHDIGKNIFALVAEAHGFEVVDLGVDVSPEKFVEAIQRYRPDIVALSGTLPQSVEAMKRTIEAIKSAGLRNNVKILIGGRVSQDECKLLEADACTNDAINGVRIALQLVKSTKPLY